MELRTKVQHNHLLYDKHNAEKIDQLKLELQECLNTIKCFDHSNVSAPLCLDALVHLDCAPTVYRKIEKLEKNYLFLTFHWPQDLNLHLEKTSLQSMSNFGLLLWMLLQLPQLIYLDLDLVEKL